MAVVVKPPSRSLRQLADRAGVGFTRRAAGLGGFFTFSAKAIWHSVVDVCLRLKFRKVVLTHISDIVAGAGAFVVGGGMVFVVAAMALAVGATVGVQAFTGLSQIGAESFVGLAGSYANTREITPLIAAVALSAQVGSSFTAEIGAMRISDEIDALEVMSIPSLTYLVCTRLVGMVAALIPLYLVALFTSFFGTRLVTTVVYGMSPGLYDYYFHLYLPPIDILYSLIKVTVFAVEVSLIHSYFGYFATGGPAGVGRAVGVAIRSTIIVVVLTNLLLSYLFWGGAPTVSLTG
jgi:phospholipid/cholesterol/gamma-HCH transport system permease protein